MRLAALLFLGASGLLAGDVYLAQSDTGSASGASCANAKAYTYFNSAGNWSATPTGVQIGPGTTVHVCGTITISGGASALVVQGDGAAGNPVIVRWEPGAVLQSPYFAGFNVNGSCSSNCGGAVNITNHDYIVIDGGSSGIIQNTANGVSLANQQPSVGVYARSNNVIVRGLTIRNLYLNDGASSGATDIGGYHSVGITVFGGTSSVVVCGNTISAASIGILSSTETTGRGSPSCQSNTFTGGAYYLSNVISDSHWHIKIGGGGEANVAGNEISDWLKWQYPTSAYHTDGIIIFGDPDKIVDTWVYNNYIHGDLGDGSPTGFVFCTYGGTGSGSKCTIFNNVFVGEGGQLDTKTVFWPHGPDGHPLGPFRLYNNTFVNSGYHIGGNGDAITVYDARNNLFVGGPGGQTYFYSQQSAANLFSNLTVNNNLYYRGRTLGAWNWGGGTYASLAAWRTACSSGGGSGGCDSAAVAADPLLTGTYSLSSGSPAIGAGANLSSLGITALNSDKAGAARGSVWDIGAYQYSTAPPPSAGINRRGSNRGGTRR